MKKISFVIFSLLIVASCSGDVRDNLGMKIDAPDEFAVQRKPGLEMPPSFKLRAPAPGEADANSTQTRDVARQQFIGNATTPVGETDAEKSFLSKAGVNAANPNIRSVLTKEYPATAEQSTLQKIRSFSDDNMNKTLVDADKEKARIEENKKNKKPVTEGETPTKSINDGKSVIDKILN